MKCGHKKGAFQVLKNKENPSKVAERGGFEPPVRR